MLLRDYVRWGVLVALAASAPSAALGQEKSYRTAITVRNDTPYRVKYTITDDIGPVTKWIEPKSSRVWATKHKKSVTVQGTGYKDGKVIGDITRKRVTIGSATSFDIRINLSR